MRACRTAVSYVLLHYSAHSSLRLPSSVSTVHPPSPCLVPSFCPWMTEQERHAFRDMRCCIFAVWRGSSCSLRSMLDVCSLFKDSLHVVPFRRWHNTSCASYECPLSFVLYV